MKNSPFQNKFGDPVVIQFTLEIHDANEARESGDELLPRGSRNPLAQSDRSVPRATLPVSPKVKDLPTSAPLDAPALEGSLDRDRLEELLQEKEARDVAATGEPDIEIALVLYV